MSCSQNSLQMSSRFSQQTIAFSSYFFVPRTLYSFPYGARSWAALLQDTLRHTAGCWARREKEPRRSEVLQLDEARGLQKPWRSSRSVAGMRRGIPCSRYLCTRYCPWSR